jgi:hypothetical protein
MTDKDQDKEIWKVIPSNTGYMVSNRGRVRARFRTVLNKGKCHFRKAKMISPAYDDDNYLFVILSKKGKTKKAYIHQLVIEAFKGPNPDRKIYSVDHINRNRQDNRPENLRYATVKEQAQNRGGRYEQ